MDNLPPIWLYFQLDSPARPGPWLTQAEQSKSRLGSKNAESTQRLLMKLVLRDAFSGLLRQQFGAESFLPPQESHDAFSTDNK